MKEKIIFLDTETTDTLKEPWMIQLGYIVCDLMFNEIKRENMYFATDKDIDFWSMSIHHITPEILREKLSRDIRTDKGKKLIVSTDFEWAYLVAHNSSFDKKVLDCNWIVTQQDQWIDSYNIAYWIFTNDDMKYSLQYLRYFLWTKFTEEINPHDAISDVVVLKEVFKEMFYIFKYEADEAWYEVENFEHFDNMVKQTQWWIILRTWGFWKYKWKSFADTFEINPWYFNWMKSAKEQDWNTDDATYNTIIYYLNKNKTL